MKINIIKKEKEELLKRERVEFEISFEGATPSIYDVRKELAKELKIDIENLIVRKIMNKYGIMKAVGYAYIYENKDELVKVERDYVKKKNRYGEKSIEKNTGEGNVDEGNIEGSTKENTDEESHLQKDEKVKEKKEKGVEGKEEVEKEEEKKEKEEKDVGKEDQADKDKSDKEDGEE